MPEITKKIWPESFELILKGEKTYDIRLADWKINPGDTLILREWDLKAKKFTGREICKKVGYVGKTKGWQNWSVEEIEKYGFQVISLLEP